MPDNRLNPSVIKSELESLIKKARPVEPNLANRLSQIKRSIKNFVPAELIARKILVDFLTELVEDSKFYLALVLSSSQERMKSLENLTNCEKYWYLQVFPNWFSKHDPNLSTWFGKIKSREFIQKDKRLLVRLSKEIEDLEGDCIWGYILDLSMATDLIVSASLNQPLCVQLTTSSENWVQNKKENWKSVLNYWDIERGLFISVNPQGEYGTPNALANHILLMDAQLPSHCYHECYI